MNQISHTIEDHNINICHDFDFIVGIGVRGVLALMLALVHLQLL